MVIGGSRACDRSPSAGGPPAAHLSPRALSLIPGTLAERMGIALVEASADRVVGTMPVEGNIPPLGLLHGGASCVLAETLGSIAAMIHATELFGGVAVGIDIHATHHRAGR